MTKPNRGGKHLLLIAIGAAILYSQFGGIGLIILGAILLLFH